MYNNVTKLLFKQNNEMGDSSLVSIRSNKARPKLAQSLTQCTALPNAVSMLSSQIIGSRSKLKKAFQMQEGERCGA